MFISGPTVAPHTGAWIETSARRDHKLWNGSPPTRGRGLKHSEKWDETAEENVAPHTGAWIETIFSGSCGASCGRRPPHGGVD